MNDNDNINISEIKTLLELHFAKTDKQLADFRKDFAEFREQNKDIMNYFKSEIRSEINSIKEDFISRYESIHSEIITLQNDVTGLKHDVANLQTWNYWTLSIILAIIAMPQIVAGIKALFEAISEGIGGITALFRKENKGSQ